MIGELLVIIHLTALRVIAKKRAVECVSLLAVLLLIDDKVKSSLQNRLDVLGDKNLRVGAAFTVFSVSNIDAMLTERVGGEGEFGTGSVLLFRKKRKIRMCGDLPAAHIFRTQAHRLPYKIGEIVGREHRAVRIFREFSQKVCLPRVRKQYVRECGLFPGAERFQREVHRKISAVAILAPALRIRNRAALGKYQADVLLAFPHFQSTHPRRVPAAPKMRGATGGHTGHGIVIVVEEVEAKGDIPFHEKLLPTRRIRDHGSDAKISALVKGILGFCA